MNTKLNLLLLSFFVGSHYVSAMESITTPEQKMVKVQCCDTNCKTHLLAEWKLFESISFHTYYLKNNYLKQKDAIIKLPSTTNISCEKMNLFSQALDYALLSKELDVNSKKFYSKELFKEYFEALTAEQQRLLINIAGRFDEAGIMQLNSPMLCAELVDAYFKDKFFLNNNIKSLINENKLDQEDYYISQLIKYNLETFNFNDISLRNYVVHTNERGYINNVPSRLTVKGAVINDQGSYFVTQKCIDKINRDVFRWKELENWQYGVQHMNEGQAEQNRVLLWSINKNKKKTTCMAIEHPKNIRQEFYDNQLIRCFFSRNSEYLITNSSNSVYATKITSQENGLSIFKTYQIVYDDRIMGVCFNSDDTQLIVSSVDKDRQGKLRLFNMSGECIKSVTIDVIPYSLFDFNGQKTGVSFALKLEAETIKYSCIFINDALEICAKKDCLNIFEEAIHSPDNNYWAILTKGGFITLICINSGAEPLFYDISTQKANLVSSNRKKLLFSSDSKSLIVLGLYKNYNYSNQASEYIIDVFSTRTGEKRASTKILLSDIEEKIWDLNKNYSFGLTPSDEDLVLYAENSEPAHNYYRIFRKPFFFKEDQEDVNFFLNTAPVSVLAILRRLYVAQKNKDKVIFYEEEPAYKILHALDKSDFIKKCLCFSVIDNKKDIFSLLISKVAGWYASIKSTKNA